MRARSAIVAVAVAACSSCAGGGLTGSPSPSELSDEQAAKPSVEITYPQSGTDPIPMGDVLVALTVRSFEISDRLGSEPKDGQGHLVYYLDVGKLPTKAGSSAIAEGAGRSEASAMTSHTWKGVGPGEHELAVQLVNNDDTPLEPAVTDTITIAVGRQP